MDRTSREIWAERVAAWRASGTSAEEYANSIGVNANTLSNWGWKLRTAARSPASKRTQKRPRRPRPRAAVADFVELAAPGITVPEARFEVTLRSGHQVRVPMTFDQQALGRLLGALEVA